MTTALASRVVAAETAALRGIVGRANEARAALLALLCRAHALYLGPPGTAKTLTARRLAGGIKGARTCYRALHPWSAERDLIGSLDLTALARGEQRRDEAGGLYAADVAIVDEAFRGSDGLRSALLTALNERTRNDGSPIPLQSAILAANDPPEGGLADAFADRVLFRVAVAPLDREMRAALLAPVTAPETKAPLALGDIVAARAEIAAVNVPEAVITLALRIVDALRTAIQEAPPVSDRRLCSILAPTDASGAPALTPVRAAAWLAGRTEAEPADLNCLRWLLWHTTEQRAALDELLTQYLPRDNSALELLLARIGDVAASCAPGSLPAAEAAVTALAALGAELSTMKRTRAVTTEEATQAATALDAARAAVVAKIGDAA